MLAGSFATATTYPFDLLRTRFAIQGETKVELNKYGIHSALLTGILGLQ